MAVPIRPEDLLPVPSGVVAADANLIIDDGDGVWKATPPQVLEGAGGVSSAELAASGGSALLGFISAGTGAVATTIQERERRTVRAFDYYSPAEKAACLAGTLVDVSTSLTKAITYAKTLIAPHLIVDYGQHYLTSGVVFDLPDSSTITFEGMFLSTVSSGNAVQIGKATSSSFINAHGLKIVRSANDTAGSSVGVKLVNLLWSGVDVVRCGGFREGLVCIGDGFGCAHLNVFLGALFDNRTSMRWGQENGGYCNAIRFYGGSFNHSDTYPAVSTIHVQSDHAADPAKVLNNISMYEPSFEDNAVGAVVAVINGQNIRLYGARLENPADQANYQIQLTVNSNSCRIMGGFGLADSNIDDLGGANCYETTEGFTISRQTAAGASKGVLTLQSTSDNDARAWRVLDTGGDEVSYMTCSGNLHIPAVYDASGNLVLTTQGAAIASPSGGATVDAEARTAIGLILARMRASTPSIAT